MKPWFHLWILKPNSSQSSGCKHNHQTNWKSLTSARKPMAAVFWDMKGVLMEELLQQGTTITSEVYCETQKTCVGPFRTKGMEYWHWCSAPPWQCASAYSCSHSSTAGAFQLGVVWPPALEPWSRSERLLPVYLKNWLRSQRLSSGVTVLKSSLSIYLFFYIIIFVIACFVNSSPEVTIRITLVTKSISINVLD
jgi:hypothetical protein